MSETSIDIQNVGPVDEFSYDMKQPGVHVLVGDQGVGKSTILRAVQIAVTGSTAHDVEKKDKTAEGRIEVAGHTVKIKKRISHQGELDLAECVDVDVASLHSPRFKTDIGRDAARIKTLAVLAGIEPDVSLFRDAFGDHVTDEAWEDVEAGDVIELASRVKRLIEKTASEQEKQAESLEDKRQQIKARFPDDIDMSCEADETKLNETLEAAIVTHSELKTARSTGVTALERSEQLKTDLESAIEGYDGPTVEAAESDVESLKQQVLDLRSQLESCEQALNAAEVLKLAATQHADNVKTIRDALGEAELLNVPTEKAVEEAAEAIDEARAAVETGRLIRERKEADKQVEEIVSQMRSAQRAGSKARQAAGKVFGVISDLVNKLPECPLSIITDDDGNPRLVMATSRSETEPFDQLSDGERWSVIIPLTMGEKRLVVIPQAAWGELQPKTKKRIHQLAVEHGCFVLTAEATDGRLEGKVFE